MPYFVGEQGVWPSLVGWYKPVEYGKDGSWELLVRSGLRADVYYIYEGGMERNSWERIRHMWISAGGHAHLSGKMDWMGKGRTDGSSRAKMAQEYERLRHQPIWINPWKIRETRRLGCFLLLPNPHTGIPNNYFEVRGQVHQPHEANLSLYHKP